MRRLQSGPAGPDVVELVAGGPPAHEGAVRASAQGEESVLVTAPNVRFSATAALVDNVELEEGSGIQFGWAQTVNQSRRDLIYSKDGAEVLRKSSSVSSVRDAQYRSSGGELTAAAPAPFYATPQLLTQQRRSAQVNTRDQPSFDAAREEGGAVLTRVEGSDQFTGSWATKHGGAVAHLQSHNWSVPWSLDISSRGSGSGGEVSSSETDEIPSMLHGEIAVNAVRNNMEIPSAEAAMALSPDVLFRAIHIAASQSTREHARTALSRKNPTLSMTLTVVSSAEMFTSDDIQMKVTGHRTAETHTQTIPDGQSATFTLAMSQILDASNLRSGFRLNFEARDTGLISNDPAHLHWDFPFPDCSSPVRMVRGPSNCEYRMTAVWG